MDFQDFLDFNLPFHSIREHKFYLLFIDHLINSSNTLRPNQLCDLHLKKGIIFLKLGKYIESKNEFNIAISINPNNYYQFLCRGCSKIYLGELEEAYQDYIHGIFLNSLDPKSFLLKGKLELMMEEYYEAINTFEIIKNKFFFNDFAVYQATNHQMKVEEIISKKKDPVKKGIPLSFEIMKVRINQSEHFFVN